MVAIVTGGAGFIGSHLTNTLLDLGHTVIVIDKLTYAADFSNIKKTDKCILYKHDICDIEAMSAMFGHPNTTIDVVFHLAAESHVDNSLENPSEFIQTNVVGTSVLLQQCLKIANRNPNFRFIHVSTDEVFGHLPNGGYFNETSLIQPRSPYSASKASSDLLALSWFTSFNFPVIVTNCSNNFGPHQHAEKFIPVILKNLNQNTEIPVYGNGMNVRDWLYVQDHVDALILLWQKGVLGERYCIGGDNEQTNLNLIHELANASNRIPKIKSVKDRKGHDMRYAINSIKLKTLGWVPKVSFEEGIKLTVDWYGQKFSK